MSMGVCPHGCMVTLGEGCPIQDTSQATDLHIKPLGHTTQPRSGVMEPHGVRAEGLGYDAHLLPSLIS